MKRLLYIKTVMTLLCCALSVPGMTQTAKTVTVKKAGQLATLLSDDERLGVEQLTIIGKLNSADVKVIRLMAGARDKGDAAALTGRLRHLDLSQAEFTNDRTPFLTQAVGKNYKVRIRLADIVTTTSRRTGETSVRNRDQVLSSRESRYSGSSKRILSDDVTRRQSNAVLDNGGQKEFVLYQLTDEEWKEMLRHHWNEHTDHYESRPDGDSLYYINCHTAKHWISSAMFADCKTLETVVLNENTEQIAANSFANCRALREIMIPRKVQRVSTSAFRNTHSLRKVAISGKTECNELKLDAHSIAQRLFATSSAELEIDIY